MHYSRVGRGVDGRSPPRGHLASFIPVMLRTYHVFSCRIYRGTTPGNIPVGISIDNDANAAVSRELKKGTAHAKRQNLRYAGKKPNGTV